MLVSKILSKEESTQKWICNKRLLNYTEDIVFLTWKVDTFQKQITVSKTL